MATKVKVKPRPSAVKAKPRTVTVKVKSKPAASGEVEPLPEAWNVPPANMGECLERIRALGHRVDNYVRFMKGIDGVKGTSAESRSRALTAFYERMLMFDRELGRVQEELQLG
jgi:hypothetical protein